MQVVERTRRARAVHDSCASARIRLITLDRTPVQSSEGAGPRPPQRFADRLQRAQIARARRTVVEVRFDRHQFADGSSRS